MLNNYLKKNNLSIYFISLQSFTNEIEKKVDFSSEKRILRREDETTKNSEKYNQSFE